jgi:hypothetical protein
MLLTPQLRHTIESSFLPLACECMLTPDGAMMIRIYDEVTGHVALRIDNLSVDSLTSVRAVSELIAGLRYDLQTVTTTFGGGEYSSNTA